MITRIEQHTGAPVEWGGVVHRNTDHPHAHILVRGKLPSGEPLRLPADLIRKGLRDAVQSSLTRQLGPRTIEEIEQQRRVELTANRVTPLDRKLAGRSDLYAKDSAYRDAGTAATAAELARLRHLKDTWSFQTRHRGPLARQVRLSQPASRDEGDSGPRPHSLPQRRGHQRSPCADGVFRQTPRS